MNVTNNNPKVVILGGGVAGMSAAHELIERGFRVEVYESKSHYVGGKARSIDVPDTGTNGRKDLPGEHGFRFFPGFYQHITDTMKRIPYGNNPNGVLDNLVVSTRAMMARNGKPPLITLVNFPRSLADLKVLFGSLKNNDTGLTEADIELFARKIWQVMTSCRERRNDEYERMSWWEFMDTDRQCSGRNPCPYQEYFVSGLTHTLVAAQARIMSTKTGGNTLTQLIYLMSDPATHADRVLNGPTNEVWLNPWKQYLDSKGVVWHSRHELENIVLDVPNSRIGRVQVRDWAANQLIDVQADYYIMAMPVEVMAKFCTKELVSLDTRLGYVPALSESVNWMNGIQYFLDRDVPLTHGHVIFIDSPWAVTAISQPQFWPNHPMTDYGDGQVHGIISTDVSNWFVPGYNGKMASECTKQEIIDEVWAQMERSLNINGQVVIDKSWIRHVWLDHDITQNTTGMDAHGYLTKNKEPLLVNKANSWCLRPDAFTHVENMLLASDYVRTNTDLATMEGANEAARRAVNCIIDRSGMKVPDCKIWELPEPWILSPLKWLDKRRYQKGLPWSDETPWLYRMLHWVLSRFH
jgi:uncharacterized protein with NAD-binding domain and iron-sulfur cluster